MRVITPLLFVCIIAIAIWRMVPDLDNHPFFLDEHEFVRKSYFYTLFFVKHDFKDPRWYDSTLEGGALQPKAGPYIFGFVFHLLGYNDIEKTFDETGFNTITVDGIPWYKALWLKTPDTFPAELASSMKLIYIARRVAMVFTIGSVALLFILCTMLVSPLFAYAASILLVANPLFSWEGRFAMTDTMQLFFFLLGLLFLVLWQRAWGKKKPLRTYGYSIALGIVSALAAGVKVTGIMLFLFSLPYFAYVFFADKSGKKRIKEFIIALGLLVIFFTGIFYVLHPYLYSNPAQHAYSMFHNRLADSYTNYFDEFPDSAIATRPSAMYRIYLRTLAPGAWYGNISFMGLPIDIILFLAGIVLLVWGVRTRILAFWTGCVFCCLSLYLYNDWSRYYLPFVTCVCISEGYAIVWLATRIRRQFGQ